MNAASETGTDSVASGATGGGAAERVDVLIVGAGLSGIGAARHLQAALPRRTYLILEARDAIGGTWDLFRYPGVRSDSDMHTLGYRFRPWTAARAIADGSSILSYINDTAAEGDVGEHIRFGHQVVSAAWSSADARWTVEAIHDGQPARLVARFLYLCTGYYRYDAGHTPDFPGLPEFGGQVVHPQRWPAGLDYDGKRIVVIGSGATAVTLVPALAQRAAHVTMLQRSPSYVAPLPAEDKVAAQLRRLLGPRRAAHLTRWKNIAYQTFFYQLSRRRPDKVKALLRTAAVTMLPEGYDVDTHFSPAYNPWDQRLCVAPDGDLYTAIRRGQASVVTDRIASFTASGISLESGGKLDADIIVTATGLRLLALGGIALSVDGQEVKLPETVAYKGVMLSGVPNCAYTFGYTNASWTLRADLVAEYVMRLLRYMASRGYDQVVPVNDDAAVTTMPLLDFKSGYVVRSIHEFPKAGSRAPWRVVMSYPHDLLAMRFGRISDGVLRFSRRRASHDPASRQPVPAGGR
jgi:cation diffusion facilitator CzcD-associated flavoprotein CzcO